MYKLYYSNLHMNWVIVIKFSYLVACVICSALRLKMSALYADDYA